MEIDKSLFDLEKELDQNITDADDNDSSGPTLKIIYICNLNIFCW